MADLRMLQKRTKCPENKCLDIVLTFAKYFKVAPADFTASFRRFDRNAQKQAGATFIRLNGCPKCNHVYLPEDARTCERHLRADFLGMA